MSGRRATPGSDGGPPGPGTDGEWLGGRFTPPFFVTDRAQPYRVSLAVWMELPEGLIVGQRVEPPEEAAFALGRALLGAMRAPLAGPPRRPARIRVADPALAAEVRATAGDAIPIEVAPTPELDELVEHMIETMPGDDREASYLDDGRIPTALVAELFEAARLLYRIAPWKVASDSQVLRMDVPALGVEGACVSIIGALGESLGLIIFPSLDGYLAFVDASEDFVPGKPPVDIGTGWLAVHFERGADLPAGMRREAAAHGWPVADAKAYPVVERRERDGARPPVSERDVRIAAACASALAAFFVKHRDLFANDDDIDTKIEAMCESYSDENDLVVRFTVPYDAFPLFDVSDAPGRREPAPATLARPAVGRNAPCPCGSGKKYKKCHLPLEEAARAAAAGRARVHDLDGRLVHELSRFASKRFGAEWERFAQDFANVSAAAALAVPWSVYCFRVQDRPVLAWYLEARGRRLGANERAWLEAQRAAGLSVWEVTAVEAGRSVTLRDLLSHEVRCVREASASQSLVPRDALLARVVDHEGGSVLCGTHPRPLPPMEAAEVVRRARGRLRRKGAVPAERLRDEPFGRYLIRRWEKAVEEFDWRRTIPPEICNTDGDPLLITTDRFAVAPGVRAAVEGRLATLEGVQPPEAHEDPPAFVFLGADDSSRPAALRRPVLGRACLRGDTLELETNSLRRADALRERIEEALGDLVHHRAREHTDPMSRAIPRGPAARDRMLAPPPEADELVLEFKKRHYAGWLDESIPALAGLSPREAVQTPRGRTAVDVLLKHMENLEHRMAGNAAFDFSEVRRALHLE
jgi:hypothetical protein